MNCFAVIREAGPAWSDGGITAQPAVDDHAWFMNALADEGFVHFAGPLAGSEHGRLRALLIVEAADAEEIRRRLADDPCRTYEDVPRLGHMTGQHGPGAGNEGPAQISAIT